MIPVYLLWFINKEQDQKQLYVTDPEVDERTNVIDAAALGPGAAVFREISFGAAEPGTEHSIQIRWNSSDGDGDGGMIDVLLPVPQGDIGENG